MSRSRKLRKKDQDLFIPKISDPVALTQFDRSKHVQCKYSCNSCQLTYAIFVRIRIVEETLESYTHEIMGCCDVSHSMFSPECENRDIDLIMPVSQLTDEEFADARNRYPETPKTEIVDQGPYGSAVGHSAAYNERILNEDRQQGGESQVRDVQETDTSRREQGSSLSQLQGETEILSTNPSTDKITLSGDSERME